AITQLLVYAARQPWRTVFRDSLPVAGVDGSLQDRLKSTTAQGRGWGKTGSLGGVRTLSWDGTPRSGEQGAFAIMTNNFNQSHKEIMNAVDLIVEAIVEDQAK